MSDDFYRLDSLCSIISSRHECLIINFLQLLLLTIIIISQWQKKRHTSYRTASRIKCHTENRFLCRISITIYHRRLLGWIAVGGMKEIKTTFYCIMSLDGLVSRRWRSARLLEVVWEPVLKFDQRWLDSVTWNHVVLFFVGQCLISHDISRYNSNTFYRLLPRLISRRLN